MADKASAGAGVGSLYVSPLSSLNEAPAGPLSAAGAAAVAAAAPSRTDAPPATTRNPTGGADGGADIRDPPSPSNIGRNGPVLPAGTANGIVAPAATGLSAEQRCKAANGDMARCMPIKDQIALLEKQEASVCVQCDQIRAQLADLRKQLTPPVQVPPKQIVAPAPVFPNAKTLRYGPTLTLTQANIDAACGAQLPELDTYASGPGPEVVQSSNYANKIKPLITILTKSKDPQLTALRDELKSYDPPGAFMRTFGRKAKNKAPLRNVAGRISGTLGCGKAARAQQAANVALEATLIAEQTTAKARNEAERRADPAYQAGIAATAALRAAGKAPTEEQRLSQPIFAQRAAAAAQRAALLPGMAGRRAPAPPAASVAIAAPPRAPRAAAPNAASAASAASAADEDEDEDGFFGPMEGLIKKRGGARRKARRSRKARKTRRARKTAKK